MRIAFFMRDLAGGGAERAAVNLMNEFAARGLVTDLVLVRDEGEYRRQLDPRVRVVSLNTPKTALSIGRLARYLRVEKPSALVSFQTHVNVAALLAVRLSGREIPVVVSEQVDPTRYAQQHPSSLIRAAFWMAPRVYAYATAVVGVSEGVVKAWRRLTGLPASKVVKIYNPVYRPEVQKLAVEDPGEPWLEDGEVPVILAVGRLDTQKNYPMLLNAFALTRRALDCRLIILGQGPLEDDLRRTAAELGVSDHVRFAGFCDNPYSFMARAHAFALSSDYEGLPTVLIEALGCGARVVSTDCPYGPDEILEGGRWGELVPVGDSKAFSVALSKALQMPRPGADVVGRAEVFGAARVADQYLDLMLGMDGNA